MTDNPINIHAGLAKETLAEVRETVVAILLSPVGDNVKVAALDVIKGAATYGNLTISHCHFETGGKTYNEAPAQFEESAASMFDEPADEEDGA